MFYCTASLKKEERKKTKTNYSENFEKNRSQKKRQTGCSSLNSGLGIGGWGLGYVVGNGFLLGKIKLLFQK